MNLAVLLMPLCVCFGLIFFVTVAVDKHAKKSSHGSSEPVTGRNVGRMEGLANLTRHYPVLLVLVVASFASLEAQEVVHATVGTLIAKSIPQQSLTLRLNSGAVQVFKEQTPSTTKVSLEESLQAATVPAADFQKVGDTVVLLYYGYGTGQTAVGIEDLGDQKPATLRGTVTDFDKHQHLLQLRGDHAAPTAVSLDERTIVDTQDGVISGVKYHPRKNEEVEVVPASEQAGRAAAFVSAH